MAHPHLATTLVHFEANMHRTKNRLIAIPAAVQRQLSLRRRRDNHILLYSIRRAGKGRWNHHYGKLSYDNEFAVPSDVKLAGGDRVEIKIHRLIRDVAAPLGPLAVDSGASVLLSLVARERPGWRSDGAQQLDEYLREEIRGEDGVR